MGLADSYVYLVYRSENCGSPITGILGIPPPTVDEYLCSASNNLVILIPLEEPHDHIADEEGEYKYYS
jgi:hypothetical protein